MRQSVRVLRLGVRRDAFKGNSIPSTMTTPRVGSYAPFYVNASSKSSGVPVGGVDMSPYTKAMKKLEAQAGLADAKPESTVTLTAVQAKAVLEHIRWLGAERARLLNSTPSDDHDYT